MPLAQLSITRTNGKAPYVLWRTAAFYSERLSVFKGVDMLLLIMYYLYQQPHFSVRYNKCKSRFSSQNINTRQATFLSYTTQYTR